MEIRRYAGLLWRRWWVILLGTALAAGIGFFLSRSTPSIYRATATLFVNQVSSPGTVTYSDALLNEQLVKTYSQMVTQPVVMDGVRERLKLNLSDDQLAKMVTARPVVGTQLLDIVVDAGQPALARDVANGVAAVFIDQQSAFLPTREAGSLRVAQPALQPFAPIWPRVDLVTVLGGLLGALITFAVVALIEYLDDTIKTPDDLERAASLASMGAITRISGRESVEDGLIAEVLPRSPAAEAYRLLRTNLEFASVDRPLATILITSASPGDGKSTTTANLAVTLAQAGKRVVIVDGDLRKPSQHRLFGVRNERGLTNLLLYEMPEIIDWDALNRCITPTRVPGLQLLTSGPLPPNPAELLASSRMTFILERLKTVADIILIDSPPAINLADPVVLASRADGTLLVVDSRRTRAEGLREACLALSKSGTRMLGAVLNKVGGSSGRYYTYYRYYGADGPDLPTSLPRAKSERAAKPIAARGSR